MNELEEVLADVIARLETMHIQQLERWARGGWSSVEQFLNSQREDDFSTRMRQLHEAKVAIEAILGR